MAPLQNVQPTPMFGGGPLYTASDLPAQRETELVGGDRVLPVFIVGLLVSVVMPALERILEETPAGGSSCLITYATT